MVVTPKAILSWDREAGEWVLDAVNPGSTVEDVQANTGFSLRVSPGVRMTPPPTEQELLVLRTIVRPKLERIYPEFAWTKIRLDKK